MTNGWMKIQIHKNNLAIIESHYVQKTISVRACFDDFCYRRHRPVPFGGRRLWNDYRHRQIGNHRFGVLNLWGLHLVNHRLVNHRLLDHLGVRGREDHFFVAVGDRDESLLAESTLLL